MLFWSSVTNRLQLVTSVTERARERARGFTVDEGKIANLKTYGDGKACPKPAARFIYCNFYII